MDMGIKIRYIIGVLLLLIQSCDVSENTYDIVGNVNFKSFSVELFSSGLVNGRVGTVSVSSWVHQYKTEAGLQIQNTQTGQRNALNFNPNNPGATPSINLPYGNYTYFSEVSGDLVSPFLPFSIEGFFTINSANTNVSLVAKTTYGLLTVKNQYVEKVEVTMDGQKYPMALLEDNSFYFSYIKSNSPILLTITESFSGSVINREFIINPCNHFNLVLELKEEGAVNMIDLVMDAFSFENETVSVNEVRGLPPWLNHNLNYGLVQDIDGNVYRTIKIGDLTWMAENLKTTRFCNGDVIPEIQGDIEWGYFGTNAAWCYYENDPTNNDMFGKLYKIHASTDSRGLCPCGWRMPTYSETLEMIEYLGGHEIAGGKLKSKGVYWSESNIGATNDSGFSGLYGGLRISGYGDSWFSDLGIRGYWWVDSKGEILPYSIRLMKSTESVNIEDFLEAGATGLSIRCVQDS